MKDRAIALRLDNDLSIRAIAERIGVPRSTVGEWVCGVGETRHYRDCVTCRTRFATARSHSIYCSSRCRDKLYNALCRA